MERHVPACPILSSFGISRRKCVEILAHVHVISVCPVAADPVYRTHVAQVSMKRNVAKASKGVLDKKFPTFGYSEKSYVKYRDLG